LRLEVRVQKSESRTEITGEGGQLAQGRDLFHIHSAIDLVPWLRDVFRQVNEGIADLSPQVAGDVATGPDAQFRDDAEGRVRVVAAVGRLGEQSAGDDRGRAAGQECGRAVDVRDSADGAQGELAAEIQKPAAAAEVHHKANLPAIEVVDRAEGVDHRRGADWRDRVGYGNDAEGVRPVPRLGIRKKRLRLRKKRLRLLKNCPRRG
jgi:hypothetical protein